jgi:glycine/D-amino acid oxidase-like deaminating enzyme
MSKMASDIPDSLILKMMTQMISDPDLPSQNPTEAFWQLPPHPAISEMQSPQLPTTADYAILGSGITGCSVAKNLLDHRSLQSNSTVTVFEARTLTSGATGRNGGELTSFAGYEFQTLCEHHGKDEAIKIARFCMRTLNKMHELGNSSEAFKEASEVRRLRGVIGFRDEAALKKSKESFKLYDALVPEADAQVEVLSPEEALSVSVVVPVICPAELI